jgi:hypothetical protein
MTHAELLQMYFERSGALQNYWTLYVVVIGGLLAFSSLRQAPALLTTLLVSVLFASFAYKNCGALVDTTNQRAAILQTLKSIPVDPQTTTTTDRNVRERVVPTLVGPDAAGIKRFHYFCDALTLLALWAMEWRRRRLARNLPVT